MTGLEALQSVQYVTVEGKRFAVIDMDDWEALVEWLEDVEDSQVVREALDQLEAADNEPRRAGWLDWDDIKIDEETHTLSILTVRKRPPYNYQDLAELLRSHK